VIKLRHILLLVGCALLLSGCQLSLLDPKGVIAAAEKKLLIESILLMLIVVIPVVIMSFLIPWHYRESNTKAAYRPDWYHSTIMEIIWWGIPCVIIGILGWMTWVYTHKLDPYRSLAADKDTEIVEAIAMDWKWMFIYPQYHVATINYLEIPVNKPVRFFISSDGPMNSLEMPQIAGQIYAMTGMQTKLNVIATSIGEYRGLSTNYSGNGFAGMSFPVHIVSQADYQTWIKSVEKSPNHLTLDAYEQIAKPSENNPAQFFSNAAPGLFTHSIVKFMGPMPGMVLGYQSVLKKEASDVKK
jgi:cytochrome o ubiquinol oxidase subunit 2